MASNSAGVEFNHDVLTGPVPASPPTAMAPSFPLKAQASSYEQQSSPFGGSQRASSSEPEDGSENESEADDNADQEMVDDLEDKANKPKGLRKKHPRTHKEIMGRTQGAEEDKHPWGVTTDVPSELWRCWDECSRAQNRNSKVGFLSGGPDWRWGLTTRRGRRRALRRRGNWSKNRMATPFISTTSQWEEIYVDRVEHMQNRQINKGIEPNTKITLFNPQARLAARMPMLRMRTEQIYYRVKTQYAADSKRGGAEWYKHEYLLLYSAGPDEIVHTWTWGEIQATMKANS